MPNLVIIGAMRCGTTTMHRWLEAHPQVSMSRRKELDFFVAGKRGRWKRGLEWYASWFDADAPVRGESSPKYTKAPIYRGVPERMSRVIPDARLLYLVRDPIQRLISHHTVMTYKGWERRPLVEALRELDGNRYTIPGRYHEQLSRFRDNYPDERIHVVVMEELQRDREGVMEDVFRFLGVSSMASGPLADPPRNESRFKGRPTRLGGVLERGLGRRTMQLARRLPYSDRLLYRVVTRSTLDPDDRARLVAHYADDTAALRSYLGRELEGWST